MFTFKDVSHFTNLKESGAIAPCMHHVHHLWSERLDIFLLINL